VRLLFGISKDYWKNCKILIRQKNPVLSTLPEKDFFDLLCSTIRKPNEAYSDSMGSKYFLKNLNNLYLNVVVDEDMVRTA
jgi:hypothetical protein